MKCSHNKSKQYVLGPPEIMPSAGLRAGDILLHYGKWWKLRTIIIKAFTGSPYTHASIYLGNGQIAEATLKKVGKSSVAEAMKSCRHIAVFRSQCGFGSQRANLLTTFIDNLIINKSKYDILGAWRSRFNKAMNEHSRTVHEKLNDFFNNKPILKDHANGSYFCSALVATCFCEVGIIEPSAEVLLDPKTYTPAGLSEEPSFGYVFGYLVKEGHQIPCTDPFLNRSSFREIMGCDYI